MVNASPALQIHVSTSDGLPIYLQIVNGIKLLVASGRMAPGDELPPMRVLAERLVVNPNTVARAYRELETAGIVEKRRTQGTYVAGGNPILAEAERKRILTDRVDGLLVEASQLRIPTDEVVALVWERNAKLGERPASEEAAK
ncbi:GntR family transcriptional regulator [soil metagenome]